MADAFLMRRDRALRGKALIFCTFPKEAGKVACSKGAKSYTVPSAALPLGGYAFALSEEGIWTLSMENESERRTKTIEAEAGKTYSVELSFNSYLQKSGEGALTAFEATAGRVELEAEYIYYHGEREEGYSAAICQTEEAIDLSKAETLYFDILPKKVGTRFVLGAKKSKFTSTTDAVEAGLSLKTESERATLAVDVSALTGSYYIGFSAQGANSEVYIYNIFYV